MTSPLAMVVVVVVVVVVEPRVTGGTWTAGTQLDALTGGEGRWWTGHSAAAMAGRAGCLMT